MSRGWRYSSGDWNAVCDSCGKKLKASELTKRWDGLMVCKDDYEPRHQQDFLRARKDKISVPWTRPVQDTYLDVGCILAIAGGAVAGVAISGVS